MQKLEIIEKAHQLYETGDEQKYVDFVWSTLREEAEKAAIKEPLMEQLFYEAILKHTAFKESLTYRLATKLGGRILTAEAWVKIFEEAILLNGNDHAPTLAFAASIDLIATLERDPACDSILTAFMYFKGYKALQIYRVSHALWRASRKELASLMQSRSSEVFSVDIHPAARIGKGFMVDHATGLVIGETAVIGDNCSFLHGVTLGGTGKDSGDRHPKIGHNVSIGANASILGNIKIGDDCKIGAGAVVLKSVPSGATAVGSPARIILPKTHDITVLPTMATNASSVPLLPSSSSVPNLSHTTSMSTDSIPIATAIESPNRGFLLKQFRSPSFDVEGNNCGGMKFMCNLSKVSMAKRILGGAFAVMLPLFVISGFVMYR
jgi:serine O-acetyltransferase